MSNPSIGCVAAEEGGKLVSAAELERLQGILKWFPTTPDEDARILEGGMVTTLAAHWAVCFMVLCLKELT